MTSLKWPIEIGTLYQVDKTNYQFNNAHWNKNTYQEESIQSGAHVLKRHSFFEGEHSLNQITWVLNGSIRKVIFHRTSIKLLNVLFQKLTPYPFSSGLEIS